MVPILVWTEVSATLWDFVTLWLIWGCASGPLEASALGGKTSSPGGKVRRSTVDYMRYTRTHLHTCGCAGKTVKSLENTCHTWVLLQSWFTAKRRYIKCMDLTLLKWRPVF